MRSFEITENRTFMTALFAGSMFERMQTESVKIVTSCSLQIDGRQVSAFYTKEELQELPSPLPDFVCWKQLRDLCFTAVKGKKTPVSFQIVFHADQSTLEKLIRRESCRIEEKQVQALVLTVRYEQGVCRLTSGTSLREFIPDKSLDLLWDEEVQSFLTAHGIGFSVR